MRSLLFSDRLNYGFKMKNGEMAAHSQDVSKLLNIKHVALVGLIKKYLKDFREFGDLDFFLNKETGGRPGSYCYLNEEQVMYAVLLARNSAAAFVLKLELVSKKIEMENQIAEILLNDKNCKYKN